MKAKDTLSPRESEVAALLKAGRSHKEIASGLFITTDTVKTHVRSIRNKLNITCPSTAVGLLLLEDEK